MAFVHHLRTNKAPALLKALSARVNMNTAIGIEKYGDLAGDLAGGIAVMRKPVPKPGPGEVLVRLNLRPIHPADAMSLAGVFPAFKPAQVHGAVVGLEGVGVVKENGAGASRFRLDQRVVSTPWPSNAGDGTWQQYVAVKEEALLAVPDDVDDVAAAQFYITPLTAMGIVELAAVPAGGWLLNSGAATAVGKLIIGVAKVKGVKTINLVRNQNRVEELLALGANEVIDVTTEDVIARVKAITGGKGAYAAADCVGGERTAALTRSLRERGTLIVWGAIGGFTTTMFVPDFIFRHVRVRGFWLGPWLNEEAPDRHATLLAGMRLIADGTLQLEAVAGRADINDVDAVRAAVVASRKPGQTGRYFIEG